MENLISSIETFVQDYMSHYDSSHDYSHIRRVLALAKKIEAAELSSGRSSQLDPNIVTLAALLHDVGDKKYLREGEDGDTMVQNLLLARGASPDLARKVQIITKHVFYSSEIKNPALVKEMILQYPELAVVQDADRLDAIGAVGIGRTFTFGGAKGFAWAEDSKGPIEHFHEKLEKLEGMMKTTMGKVLASERTERLKIFRGWWEEEVGDVI